METIPPILPPLDTTPPAHLARGKDIIANSWVFDSAVCRVFDDHVRHSVPSYDRFQDMAVSLCRSFCPSDGLVVDLGASTGTTLYRILADRKVSYRAFDNSPSMVDEAARKGVVVELADFREDFTVPPCNVVLSLFTLQFLPYEERFEMIQKIYAALKAGGVLFLCEKTLFSTSVLQNAADGYLNDYKKGSGITDEAIVAKEKSLRGVMPLLEAELMVTVLAEAGFTVETLVKDLHFTGWVCVKM